MILSLEDPKARVGSGGATLNALLIVAEHLSAKAGFGVCSVHILHVMQKNSKMMLSMKIGKASNTL